jgi:hypothetical protein
VGPDERGEFCGHRLLAYGRFEAWTPEQGGPKSAASQGLSTRWLIGSKTTPATGIRRRRLPSTAPVNGGVDVISAWWALNAGKQGLKAPGMLGLVAHD